MSIVEETVIRVKLGSDAGRKCPVCGASTVWAQASDGALFRGCSRAPVCAGVRALPKRSYLSCIFEVGENSTPATPPLPAPPVKAKATKGHATHKALAEVLLRINAGIKNIMLVGPSGSGKTKLAADVATHLGLEFSAVSMSAGMPEWHLLGRGMPNLTTGENVYEVSAMVTRYEKGGVGLWDEFDAADANTLLVANAALSNGHLSLPARAAKPVAVRHEDFVCIAAGNTWGQGANRQYTGRNQLDASTLSRFACAMIFVDYDRELETELVGDQAILSRVWAIRDSVARLAIRQVVGTRELLNVMKLVKAGSSLAFAVSALTASWTPDEKSRVAA